jgi:hypothetical protein
MKKSIILLYVVAFMLAVTGTASADIYGGVDFPGGAASFADVVVSYDPVIKNNEPMPSVRDSSQALGIPNGAYVSLGDGGSITLRFTDNSLTASGNSNKDLWIFEVGPDVEDTYVEISKDGSAWHAVGKVLGSTSGIDIDAFGWTQTDFFSFVRLTDDTNEGDQTGGTVGADIDAVGAISSAPPVQTPEPATMLLLGFGLVGLAGVRRFRK